MPPPKRRSACSACPAGELADVTVTGSRSGAHVGRLVAYSQGDGASFLPARPFAAGELVTVHAQLLGGAAPVPFAWSFTVAVRDVPGSTSNAVGTGTTKSAVPPPPPKEFQSFHSRPQLRPPDVTVAAKADTATGGDIFIAPYSGVGQYGPMILDEHGGLIYFKPLSPAGARAADFRAQEYEGKPVLTWWQDPLVGAGSATAGDVIANSAYQEIAQVRAGNGYQPDLHEFQITPQGTALITVYDAIDCNLSAVGGPADGAVADTLLQEIDLKTGLVMYEWHSLDHVLLQDSYSSAAPTSRAEPFDYFHINSIDVEQDGDLLIDSRNTWAAYDVDPATGQVRWQLGGRHSSFKMGPGTGTAWQHDALQQPDGAITFFDNGAFPQKHSQSRAIEVALEHEHHDRHARTPLRAPEPAGGRQPGQRAGAGRRRLDGRLGPGGLPIGDRSDGPAPVQRPPAARLGDLQSLCAAVEWAARRTARRGGRARRQRPADGVRQLERCDQRRKSGACSRAPRPRVSRRSLPRPRSGFETALALPVSATPAYVAVQALDGSGVVIGFLPRGQGLSRGWMPCGRLWASRSASSPGT